MESMTAEITAESAEQTDASAATGAPSLAIPELGPDEGGWTTVIRPQRHLLDLDLSEVWRYRDLVLLFVWRDFVAAYKQYILGPAWHFIQPLTATIMSTVVFNKIAGLPTDQVPPVLFYMTGSLIWILFSNCLSNNASTFTSNAGLYGKVYFPRLVTPLATSISKLISFGIQLIVLALFYGYFVWTGSSVRPTVWLLALPVLVLISMAMGVGVGIIVSSLTTRYRDLMQLLGFFVSLWMYSTPVVYPLSMVTGKLRGVMLWNPMTPVIETWRRAVLGVATCPPSQLWYSAAFSALVLFIGIVLFTRVERTFMDTV
jgi:lipopolysaccharide transport system permease protein